MSLIPSDDRPRHSPRRKNEPQDKPRPRFSIKVRIEPDGRTVTLDGRDAWAMRELVRAGERGCTPINNPAPRWSGYVHKLRRAGFVIETIHEPHGGIFRGNHARYCLRTPVTLVDTGAAE